MQRLLHRRNAIFCLPDGVLVRRVGLPAAMFLKYLGLGRVDDAS